jgi:hypothetical protein
MLRSSQRRGGDLANLTRILDPCGRHGAGRVGVRRRPFPLSGAAKLAAYSVCRSAVIVDMWPVGSNSSAECTGIVKTLDGSKILDNLAIRCIEEA